MALREIKVDTLVQPKLDETAINVIASIVTLRREKQGYFSENPTCMTGEAVRRPINAPRPLL